MIIGRLGGLDRRDRRGELVFVRTDAARRPDLFGEQALRPVVGFGLNVLAHRQRHRPAFGGIGEHVHGALQGRNQLLGAIDAVEVARHRPEAVVGRHGSVAEVLDLLQHRVGQSVGEDVAGQQQDRQPVDMGDGGGGHHVERAGADRRGAGHEAAAEARLGEGDRRNAPSPVRCGRDRWEVCRAPDRAPRRCPPRCRGRRSPSIRRRSAVSRHRSPSSDWRETAPAPAPP